MPTATRILFAIFVAAFAQLSWAAPPPLTLRPVASGLSSPLAIANAGDGSGRLFIAEKGGRIRILRDGALLPTPFLDISSIISTNGERGLLGLAFDPQFVANRRFFVFYTRSADGALRVSSFRASTGNPDVADAQSEVEIITIAHPGADNHNGGHIAFGPDGFLYVATGDGGGGGDPGNNAQNLGVRLGKLLRLDVGGSAGYAVASGNPFAGQGGAAADIWAYGLRNPWRFSFDRANGDLYIGDVGQGATEEVNFQPAGTPGGRNHGWRVFEGNNCFNPASNCSLANHAPPVITYAHNSAGGQSITGGYVYRGARSGLLQGYYLYGDFVSNRIWAARRESGTWVTTVVSESPSPLGGISSFGEDEAGELYVASFGTGQVFAIEAAASASETPGILSGLFWNPAESGWGIHFAQRSNLIFATLYHYDGTGAPKWYAASRCEIASLPCPTCIANTRCTGPLFEASGPRFFGVPFRPQDVQLTEAGSLDVTFQTPDVASVTYRVGTVQRTVPVQRQRFRSGPPASLVDFTDLWWNPGESGWGLAITQQAEVLFLTWYVYSDTGRPIWYVASNCTMNFSGNGCTGTLYRTTGPVFSTSFDPSQVQLFTVGSVTLDFTNGSNGVLTYTVDGVSGVKAISRQLF